MSAVIIAFKTCPHVWNCSILDEKLLKTIPLVNEANAMSDELDKKMMFAVKLMANQHKVRYDPSQFEDGEVPEQMDTDVYIQIENTDNSAPPALWHYDKFMNRLYIMREMYQVFVENDKSLSGTVYMDVENDPFYDPPEHQQIGKSTLLLNSLTFCIGIEETTPIIDYKGTEKGELMVRILPHLKPKPPVTEEELEAEEENMPERIQELKGKKLYLTVYVDGARGLPKDLCSNARAKFVFFLDPSEQLTQQADGRSMNPSFDYSRTYEFVVTDDLIT